MASHMEQEHNDHVILIWLTGAIVAILGYQFYNNRYKKNARGNARSRPAPGTVDYGNSVHGAALDATIGIRTPDDLLHFGPTMQPASWVPHRVTYPASPGMNLERLIYGAPGCYNTNTPTALRGWLFEPPSEEDY